MAWGLGFDFSEKSAVSYSVNRFLTLDIAPLVLFVLEGMGRFRSTDKGSNHPKQRVDISRSLYAPP